MKYTLLLLLVMFSAGFLLACLYSSARLEVDRIRHRAERLAGIHIVDGTRLVEPVTPGKSDIVLENVRVSYSPAPILTVEEWSEGGLVGSGNIASGLQWSCPPGYTLKWDGEIPYCE